MISEVLFGYFLFKEKVTNRKFENLFRLAEYSEVVGVELQKVEGLEFHGDKHSREDGTI